MFKRIFCETAYFIFCIFQFSCHSVKATEIYPSLVDTLTPDTSSSSASARDETFDTHGRTKILTDDEKKYLYFDLNLSKKDDIITKVFLNKTQIYDSQNDSLTSFEKNKWVKYRWGNVFTKHGIFDKKGQETYIRNGKQIKFPKFWKEEKMRLKGKFPLDTLAYTGEYEVQFDYGKSHVETVQYDFDNSIKFYLELSMGPTFANDKIYKKQFIDDYHIAGLDYYSLGYGFRFKESRTGIRAFYNGFDDKWKEKGTNFRKHIYWWEINTYISQTKWLSFNANIELEAGYKAGKFRGYYWEDNKDLGTYIQYYDISDRDHGPSMGIAFNYDLVGIKYEYSWIIGGYHAISFYNWGFSTGGSHVGTVYKYLRGKYFKDYFMIVFEINGGNENMLAKRNTSWIGWISFVLGAAGMFDALLYDPFQRIFFGGRIRND